MWRASWERLQSDLFRWSVITVCWTRPSRPQATVFSVDAYTDNFTKAAALLQSLARNHAFVDGNKRTAWAAAWTFLHINGIPLGDFDVDDAEVFMNDAAIWALTPLPPSWRTTRQ